MSKMIFIYLVFPLMMLILCFLSKKEELPESIKETGISRAYLRMSHYVYRIFRRRIKSFSSEKIRIYLGSILQKKDLEQAECEYFIRKISTALILVTAGSLLAIMMCISAAKSSHVTEEMSIARGNFGDREAEIELVAKDREGNELMEQPFLVKNRIYTEDEAEKLFEEGAELLEELILKDNESLDRVETDLNLVDSIEGLPFAISWKIDNYEVMHTDGTLVEDKIPEQGVVVTLTAIFSYEDYKWQSLFCANLVPRELTVAEKAFKDISQLLLKADEETITGKKIILPNSYDGKELIWSEKITDNSFLLLLLALIGAVASYLLKDEDLKKAIQERNKQMLMDYPQFVSQLVLYMGAGMTVRNIIIKLSDDYVSKQKSGGEKRYLYEELLRSAREMKTGASESEVYERLGLRCSGQQYTRLVTLLCQNLRKGNSELLGLLREESKKAFDERMDKARKAGEEAGTRLLLPMIIMLVIVMVVIMIPAYMAF